MFKTLTDTAKLPQRATKYSAGFDVFTNEDVVIGAGETKLVGLGIALDNDLHDALYGYDERCEAFYDSDDCRSKSYYFKSTYYFELHPRSSLRLKGLIVGVGIIDIDYVDEIKMVVHNPVTDSWNENYEDGTVDKITHLLDGAGGTKRYTINKGDKIGQLILKRHEGYLLPEEYTLDSERNGGFGSTNE
jgi:dUTPase